MIAFIGAAIAVLAAGTATAWRAPSVASHVEASVTEPPIAARLSPDGDHVAFIVGDSLFMSEISDGSTRALADGLGFEAQAARKQLVWSPDSRFLLFRRGQPPLMNYAVVQVGTGEVVNVLPDSLDAKLRTVGNLFTGPPVWSPHSDQIAFLASRAAQFGPLEVVYLATRGAQGQWSIRSLVSDGVEKTALGWGGRYLAWASRERDGRTTIEAASVAGDTIGAVFRGSSGNARVIELIPDRDGSRFLVKRAGSPPLVITLRGAPGVLPADLPLPRRLDSYVGWLSDDAVLAFQYPSDWRSELVVLDVLTGQVRRTIAAGGMLADGTIAATPRGWRIVYSEEDGSHSKSYRSVIIQPDGTVIDTGTVTPSRFAPPADPWSNRVATWRSKAGIVLEAQLLVPERRGDGLPPTVIVPYGGYRNTALSYTYFLDVLLRGLLDDGWQVIRPNTSAAAALQQTSGYGAVQLSDTHDLIDTLAAQGVVDPSRIAVVGHSHGASLAYYYATHSTAFCAVVAVNGRADWVMQARYEADGLFPRPLGASPEEDPNLYAAASPLPNARSVNARILLVAGANDGQILPVNATAMADSLQAYSGPFDLLLFEDEGHQIESRVNRDELMRRVRATLAGCR